LIEAALLQSLCQVTDSFLQGRLLFFLLKSRFSYVLIVKRIGPLEKWLNSAPSQGVIRGSESRMGHQSENRLRQSLPQVVFFPEIRVKSLFSGCSVFPEKRLISNLLNF
jgi:hypothetical protein